jgi:hypothetical protein
LIKEAEQSSFFEKEKRGSMKDETRGMTPLQKIPAKGYHSERSRDYTFSSSHVILKESFCALERLSSA